MPRPSTPSRMTSPTLRNTGSGLTPLPTPGGVPVAIRPEESARLGPALGESQRAGAERSALALGRKRAALRLNSIDRHACPERRDQHCADTVLARRGRAWLGVDQQ